MAKRPPIQEPLVGEFAPRRQGQPDSRSSSSILDIEKDYNMLSLRDLVAARDLYHLHLMDRQHVVATAVGRYLIRKSEPWPQGKGQASAHDSAMAKSGRKEARTLANSEVRPYSWPCVLVFVDEWVDLQDVGADLDPGDLVPRTLHMPDGTRVPVCVVLAQPVEAPEYEPVSARFPDQFIGGGYPILARVQEKEHIASVGCLVTDGHDVYALTNRHVAGRPGEELFSVIGGERVRVGVTSDKQLTRKQFSEVYDEWPGRSLFVNLDVGLVRVDDISRWTAQIYGLGAMGKLADLSADNISLRLIDCPVRAFGAASGPLEGQVLGLFYRYKSMGGMEYAADFLIGPRHEAAPLATRPGDSGTVWLLETPNDGLRPIAVQWGGHTFIGANGTSEAPYALATCLSTVCRLLDVDVVRDWNIGLLDFWGAVGHYTIAAFAIERIDGHKYPKLKAMMQANLARISLAGTIDDRTTSGLSKHAFIPLADVPDLAWKRGPYNRGGPENPNHFADMDAPREKGGTLLELCQKDIAKNTTVEVWRQYYTDVKDTSRGLLPFRVQQFYEGMVAELKKKKPDLKRFVCAAGIVSHYVGDACQPLHVSYRYNGDPKHLVPNPKAGQPGEPDEIPRGQGVHGSYEDDMVNANITAITSVLKTDSAPLPANIRGGPQAAQATVRLILETFAHVKPADLITTFVNARAQGAAPRDIAAALWKRWGKNTQTVMAAGARYLAMLWQSAWDEGGGEAHAVPSAAFNEADLTKIYSDPTFMPSKTLDHIGEVLTN